MDRKRLKIDERGEEMEEIQIGIIGMGDMGRLYASKFAKAGWKHINVCDRPETYAKLQEEFQGSGLTVMPDGHHVSRISDFIIYSVEAALIDAVVAQYGPSTKLGAIVSGQTSVKAPEKLAFDKYLPKDVRIVSCHSLHGPKVDTVGQPLLLIQYRASDEEFEFVQRIFQCFGSSYVFINYEDHDVVTANTQAVTHAAFLTMGTAWRCSQAYPWESGLYPGGIETVKINIMLRIYSAKWHVYAGLALLNPAARKQVSQYADSATALFKLMVGENEEALTQRVFKARREVFGWADDEEGTGGARTRIIGDEKGKGRERKPILMSDKLLDQFHMAARRASTTGNGVKGEAIEAPPPNSHLALLAIVDCWYTLQIDPYAHLDLAATPVFRLWIGVCEYLFRSPARVRAAVRAAIHDHDFRSDDTEFVIAARGWAQAVQFGDFDLYRWRFEQTREFFASRFEEANRMGAEMLKVVLSQSQSS